MSHHKVKPRNGKRAKRMSVEFKEPADQDYINTLNDDCLGRIFMYLPIRDKFTVRAVCKRWRTNPDVIWRELRILDCTSDQCTQIRQMGRVFNRILNLCGRFLQQLKLVDHVTSSIMPIIARRCHNLEKIEIQLPRENQRIFKWDPKMEKLEYFRFRGNAIHFRRDLFTTLLPQNLTELHLSARLHRSDIWERADLPEDFETLLKDLPKLSALSLEGFWLGIRICAAIHEKSTLTFLSIAKSEPFCYPYFMEMLDNQLINLEHLDLAKTADVNFGYVNRIVEVCKKLKYLNLSVGLWIGDEEIYLLRGLRQLEELVLNGNPDITDEPLSELFNLRKLECEGCMGVGDDGIIALIRYAPNLEYLNLTCSGVTERVLMVAIEVMRQRTNGVELRMFIDSRLTDSCNHNNLPPLLFLEDHRRRCHDIDYDSDYPVNSESE